MGWLEYFVGVVVFVITLLYLYSRSNSKAIPKSGGVVITGASSGIGEVTAQYLDSKGFTVFAGVRSQDDYSRLKGVLSTRSTPVLLDVTQASSITKAVDVVNDHLKQQRIGLVALINNAGLSVVGPIECLPESEMRYNFEVNVFGLINTTNAFLPLLRSGTKFPNNPAFAQDIATVIHIGSTMGRVSFPFYGPYAMTKFALEALADAQRLELSQTSNVRVSLLELGNVKTPIFERNNVRLKSNMGAMMDVYKPFLNDLPAVSEVITSGAILPIKVAQCIESALLSSNPKARYLVGWEAYMMPVIFSIVPTKLRDTIIVKLFGVLKKMKR